MALPVPLATVQEVADACGEELSGLDNQDLRMMRYFIRKATAAVRHHGLPWDDPILAPEIAITIVIDAAARGFMNPEGYELERGDEITFQRTDLYAGGAALSEQEIKDIKASAGRAGFWSVALARDVSPNPSHEGVLFTLPDA